MPSPCRLLSEKMEAMLLSEDAEEAALEGREVFSRPDSADVTPPTAGPLSKGMPVAGPAGFGTPATVGAAVDACMRFEPLGDCGREAVAGLSPS